MKENIYDNPSFFEKYSQMARSREGLSGAGEWETLRTVLPPVENKRVLDLGCGYGWHCIWAVEHGAESALGVDISARMLEVARGKIAGDAQLSERIAYRQGAIESLEFPEDSFDLVLSSLSLHYVADYPAVVEKVRRWLKPGGQFVFTVEHPVFTAEGSQDWVLDAAGNIDHFPVDNYYYEGPRTAHFLGETMTKYHRTVTTYLETLLDCGFTLRHVKEPMPPESMRGLPGMADEMRRPMMLIVAAELQDLPETVLDALHALYNASFPALRTDRAALKKRLGIGSGSQVLIHCGAGGLPVGFAVVRQNALLLLCVQPEYRNRGVGSALLERAEALMRPYGRAVLGHAQDTYIFPGVPMDGGPDAHAFFEKRGYRYIWTAYDMTLDLTAYAHRPELDCKDPALTTRMRLDTPEDRANAGACSAQIESFGGYFAYLPDILLAEWNGEIIGGCGIHPENCFYTEAFPETSTFGPLGVLEAYRNRGVGMRLCQDALDRLKAGGVKRIYIGYTWLEDWYGKLGAKRCIDYWMGEKEL